MAKRPELGEIAKADHGLLMASANIAVLMDNPDDKVLQQRGRDLRIYQELLRDDQVASTFQQRRSAVTSCEWEVQPGGEAPIDQEAADALKANLEQIKWDDVTEKMLFGVFYGYAIAECLYGIDGSQVVLADIKVRDRARFRYNTNNELRLLTINNPQGAPLPERKFWEFSVGADHSDNPYGLGLANRLYWPVFFKRNDIKFWLIFLEKFGMPTGKATLPAGKFEDQEERRKALRALQAIQTDSGIVVPDDIPIELIEAARSGTADYATLYDKMDAAIAKIVLSQTMTTENGSSRSQAEVHKGVADWVVKSDADLLCGSFNRTVARWLTEWNFPGAAIPSVWRHTEPPEDLNSRAERDAKIITLGYEPTEEYIEETYGPGWRKKAEPVTPPPALAPLGPEFAEPSPVALKRLGHRADQQQLVDAAEYLATKYRQAYGKRIQGLLDFLEETDDADTFKKHLARLMEEIPGDDQVQPIRNATLYGRLMGLFRGQR